MAFWTYILLCSDGRYYTGHTDHLERRIAQHQHGGFCDFTSRRRPVTLVWSQYFATRIEALEAERRIKPWSRAKKEALIRGDWEMVSHFAKPPHERPDLSCAPKERPPSPFVPSEVEGREVGRQRVSTALDTNGGGGSGRPGGQHHLTNAPISPPLQKNVLPPRSSRAKSRDARPGANVSRLRSTRTGMGGQADPEGNP